LINNPFIHGVLAFTLWGSFPVYFKLVQEASAGEILAHRIIWSVVILVAYLLATGRLHVLRATLFSARLRGGLLLTSLLIALNWLVFIWAVNNQHALQASLGYFICPLISSLFGFLFYGERFGRLQIFAMAFAIAGVSIPLLALGRIPWISLCLAVSFASYGSLRKKYQADPIAGLCVEALFLAPFAALWMLWLAANNDLAFVSFGPVFSFYLMLAGIVTALPLVLFASAANHIPLTAIGFLQYIAPSLQFLLAVFAFGEAFTLNDGVSFALIWTGLLIYSYDQVRRGYASRPQIK